MKGFELTQEEVVTLRAAHRSETQRWAADRIKAVVLLGTGWTLEMTSEALLMDTETLRGYVSRYRVGGLDKLISRDYKGRQGQLSEAQLSSLKTHLLEKTYSDVKSICAYVKKSYDVALSQSRIREILHTQGFVYKKPKIVPSRFDLSACMKFMNRYEKLRRSKNPVYFMDGVHPQHNSQPAHGWILKGEEKALLSNTGRKRMNINGAVSIDDHALITVSANAVNAQSTIKLLKKIERRHRDDGEINIICDNAAYYHSELVQEYIKKKNKIKLVFLPPYSPFFNLIERVWKYFKKKVLYNRYYETFREFEMACNKFLRCKHKAAFEKILTEKFHFDENISPLKT